MTDAKQIEAVLAAAESTARDEINDACSHEPDAHAEGTCEMCDFAFAADSIVQEAFKFARAALLPAPSEEGQVAACAKELDFLIRETDSRLATNHEHRDYEAWREKADDLRTLRALLSDPSEGGQ